MAKEKEKEMIQRESYCVYIERTSRRKTASIKVEEGKVIVVVPRKLDLERIEKLITDKHQWIIEKIALNQHATPMNAREYVSGEAFPYLGRNYRLKVVAGDLTQTKLIAGRILVTVPDPKHQPQYINRALVNWYKRNAEKKIREKVHRYAPMVGVETAVIRIKEFKSRWGSCTPYGDLEFNWLIMQAPNRVVDYVVIHELCHLIHHDHSPQFWKEVERVMPDFQEQKLWLKNNGYSLSV
ncbi:M48 family peptidase [Aliivibrio salmonicida]|uniref:YgjP-like metallopeptidase domain-containing protein n=1 Tax=Aliivibrio salmonicida (strain LFI1238) TaxID=316275 RepID=B6ENI4_ALISL|nr:SprT family zinc-dependent metalloprotease [Aliivibrio salmonicida]AZL85001.1 M48 family peptidase [Aliivibrio salmonicida]CAQ79474.1 conserved hypothetical protein [Aliivibrio salmonicida LFI1238]